MSKSITCDQCGTTLTLDRRGEAPNGEEAAWIRISIANFDADVCTRSCAHEFLDRPEVAQAHDAYFESIAEIARIVADDRAEDDG